MESCISSRSDKGQLSTLDLIVSMMIFLGIIYMFVWAWGEVQVTMWAFEDAQGLRDRALDITDVLLHTEGYPTDWEVFQNATVETVSSIGLASEGSVLDRDKLERMSQLPSRLVRDIMGLGKSGYHVTVKDGDGDPIYSFGEDGDGGPVIERPAIFEGEVVGFELRLYSS